MSFRLSRSVVVIAIVLCVELVATLAAAPPEPENERRAAREFVYKSTPQGDLKLYVDLPSGWKATDTRPAIVFFFGGGWTNGDVRQFATQARYLADRGMVAARADYRVKSRHGVLPDKCVEDGKSAVRWLRSHAKELGIAPDRLIASGGSAGGHVAACTALISGFEAEGEDLKISSKPAALVLFNPALRLDKRPETIERFGGDVMLARALSPTLHVDKNAPPTLLLFGTADRLFPQADEFQQQAAKIGSQVEIYTAADQPHGFFNRPPWLNRTIYRVDEFLEKQGYLRGKPTIETD